MKVSGFTFIRNAIKYDFPVREAIQSALPLVDEFVVNVGKSEDQTLHHIQSIRSEKIKIVETVWDETLRTDGKVFGLQQDVALSHCTGHWALLVQADEVLHEEDYAAIRNAMHRYWEQPDVLGLVFRMLHFKGDYRSVDPWMYRRATRVIKNNGQIRSSRDSCDFRTIHSPRMLKSGSSTKRINARVFHYGWVKHSDVLQEKLKYQKSRHEGDSSSFDQIESIAAEEAQFPKYGILKSYKGSHPQVMSDRVQGTGLLRKRKNRWLNLGFYREVFQHGFKG